MSERTFVVKFENDGPAKVLASHMEVLCNGELLFFGAPEIVTAAFAKGAWLSAVEVVTPTDTADAATRAIVSGD